MYGGGSHMGTSGVGLGWAAANVRDLENGRFETPGSVSSQQQQQASKQASTQQQGAHFQPKNEVFRSVLLRQETSGPLPWQGYE